MGNQVLKDHKIEKQPVASGGPGLAWKIYPARTKQTNEEVSIWVFDKKGFTLDKNRKNELQQFVELLKKDAQLLIKLRHPHIVRLCRPIEETKTNLFLETEPIVASLANILGKHFSNFGMNKTSNASTPSLSTNFKEWTLEDMEIKIGLLNICEALAFLHQSTQTLHLNICPENIFITRDGSWKLGGFSFALSQNSSLPLKAPIDYSSKSEQFQERSFFFPLRQNLDYLAPETVYTQTVSPKSDMFALGCLIYEIYTKECLINCNNDIALYKQQVANLFPLKLEKIPMALHGTLEKLVVADPRSRLDLFQFLDCEYFTDVLTKSLNFLIHILEKDDQSKGIFFKGLATVVGQFSPKILLQKVLSPLLSELRNTILVPFILPNLFIVARVLDSLDPRLFKEKIFPSLIPLFTIKEPFQILLLLLQHIEYIVSHVEESEIKNYIVPLLSTSFEHPTLEVQIAVLKMTPEVIHFIDYENVKNNIWPRLQSLLLMTTSQHVRINALLCLSKIVHIFSKNVIEEVILPTLTQCLNVDRSSFCLMGVTGVCDAISKKFGEQITAQRLLPLVIPFSVNESLNYKQFETYLIIVKGMLQRIEESRWKQLEARKKLEEENIKIDRLPEAQKFTKFTEFVANEDLKKNITFTTSPLLSSSEKQTLKEHENVSASTSSTTVPEEFDFVIKKQEQAKEQYQEQKMERTLVFLNDDHKAKEKQNTKKQPSDLETRLSQLNWNLPPPPSPNEDDKINNLPELVPIQTSSNILNTSPQSDLLHFSPSLLQNNNTKSTHSNTLSESSKSSNQLLLDFFDNSTTTTTSTKISVTPTITESKLATSETIKVKLDVPTNSKPSTSTSSQKIVHYSEDPIDSDFLTLRKENPILIPQTSIPSSTSSIKTDPPRLSFLTETSFTDRPIPNSNSNPNPILFFNISEQTSKHQKQESQTLDFSWFDSTSQNLQHKT